MPKSPRKCVASVMVVTSPWPSTTNRVGSITLVEPPDSVTSTVGASSSATWTSIGSGAVSSP